MKEEGRKHDNFKNSSEPSGYCSFRAAVPAFGKSKFEETIQRKTVFNACYCCQHTVL